jgi:hypothetical protein
LDNFILSHSGINENRINPFTDLRGMFPNINFKLEKLDLKNKMQIHGHVVKTIEQIKESVEGKEKRISIDSGCYLNGTGLGYLTALDLDSMQLYHQKINSPTESNPPPI